MQPMLMVPCAIASHRRSPVAVGNGMLIVVVLGTDVEDCTITVHIGYGRDAVPIVDETLRRSDPFKDWRWCADRKIAAHKEDPAAAVRITNGQSNKSRVRGGLIADIVDDGRSDDRAGRQIKSDEAPDPVRSAAGHAATRAECRPHSAAGHFFWFPDLERAGTRQRDRRPIVCVRRSKPAFLKRRWSETREMDKIPPDFSFLPIVLRAGGCEQRPRKARNRDQGARCQKAVSTDSHTPSSVDLSGCNWEGGSAVSASEPEFYFGRPKRAPLYTRSPPRAARILVAHSSGSQHRPTENGVLPGQFRKPLRQSHFVESHFTRGTSVGRGGE